MNDVVISDIVVAGKITSVVCILCKGKGSCFSVDAINADGTVVNPRKVSCMVCDGFGSYIQDENDD